ncbi:MAG: type II toxin-antitoxin system RelE/ParE family toxin [Vicinamibacterales bacterium]
MTRVRVRPKAQSDIDEAAEYYAAEATPDLARRFLKSVGRTLDRLGERPFLGARIEVIEPTLTGLRLWPVPAFEQHLVLYFASEGWVDVVRVVHSSRDSSTVFAEAADIH